MAHDADNSRGGDSFPESGIRFALVQTNPTVGDLDGNFAAMRAALESLTGKADLAVFPECSGAGYPLQDLVSRPGFLREFDERLAAFCAWIAEHDVPAAVIGGPVAGADLPYNAAWLIETDGTRRMVLKHHLPNSEVYDERRTFAPGPAPRPVPFRGLRLGLLICEDFWHGDAARGMADEGADVLVVVNGSHFKVGKQETRLRLARRAVQALDVPVIYVNQTGGQDELVFDGGSFAMNRKAGVLTELGGMPGSVVVRLCDGGHGDDLVLDDPMAAHETRQENPYRRGKLEGMWGAMVTGLRDYVVKSGFPGVIIGMSGGLDSAVAAAVAVDALGADRVRLVRMPSRLTSDASNDDAATAAGMLGVARLDTIPIGPIVTALEAAVGGDLDAPGGALARENIQSRARGNVLMALSNATGWMVVSTGNKSEMSVGYATLYGDMCGGFSVLKDAYKTEVFALARWRDENHFPGLLGPVGEVIPRVIIEKPPSAELAEGQTDEAALGSYEDLDAVLIAMVEGNLDAESAARAASKATGHGIGVDYARRIARLVHRSEFKRRQAPPGVVLGGRGYDKGWRLPLVNAGGL